MFTLNGFVYGGELGESIRVSAVKPLADMMMLITFSTGETRLFDAAVLQGAAFEPLKDEIVFRNAAVEYGVVTWMDGAIDCAPEYMFKHSYEYPDHQPVRLEVTLSGS